MKRLRRFLSRWQNLLALAIVGFYVFVAVTAPRLAPPDDPGNPTTFRRIAEGTYRSIPLPPSRDLPLGTTSGGLDVFYTLVWGTRAALRFGLVVALTTACLGVFIGATSAYFGRLINRLAMRVTDAFLTFPAIAGLWLFRQVLFPVSMDTPPTSFQRLASSLQVGPVMLTLILFSWMGHARIINGEVARLKQTEYVQAARTLGASHFRIIFRHLLPNAIAPAIILAARDIGGMVILAAAFTFIGVGGGSPWGALLVSGRDWIIGPGGNLLTYWWVYLPATLALVLFGIGWNLLGDGLNTALNPREAHRKLRR